MDHIYANSEKNIFLKKSSIWYYKNVADIACIRRRLRKQLAVDIYKLYEKSEFVDLRLEAIGGHIWSHRIIISARYPSCWRLIVEIAKLQNLQIRGNLLVVAFPHIRYSYLEAFIRALYTDYVNASAVSSFKNLLELQLKSLKTIYESHEPKLYLEKLNQDEEREIQNVLLNQLKKGEISEEKGNLKVLSQCCAKYRNRNEPVSGDYEKPITQSVAKCASNHDNPHSDKLSGRPTSAKIFTKVESQPCCPRNINQVAKSIMNTNRFIETPNTHNENTDDRIGEQNENAAEKLSRPIEENIKLCTKQNEAVTDRTSIINLSEDGHVNENITSNLKHSFIKNVQGAHSSLQNTDGGQSSATNTDISQASSVKAKVRHLESIAQNRKAGNDSFQSPGKQFRRSFSERKSSVEETKYLLTQSLHDEDLSVHGQTGLHEASSLEVELPSSQGEQSLTPDSDISDVSTASGANNRSGDEIKTAESVGTTFSDTSKHIAQGKADEEVSCINPHKPLVRTRTFDLIEPTCSAVHVEESREDLETSKHEEIKTLELPKRSSSENTDTERTSSAGLELRNSSHTEEDANKLRELERLKGYLIFEHSLQTFSNIPSTNMMVPSIMDSSVESDTHAESMFRSGFKVDVMSSVYSVRGSENQPVSLISSTSEVGNVLSGPFRDLGDPHILVPQTSQDLCNEIVNRVPDTRSPSPDSLSTELPPDSSSNINKEDLTIEEKEKDDNEESELSRKSHNKKTISSFISGTAIAPCTSSSAAGSRKDSQDNIPVVSGGSFLYSENITTNQPNGSHRSQAKRQISVCSIKDVDSIPLVCGYVSPKENMNTAHDDKQTEHNPDGKAGTGKTQSMFSMFINLDEIPTPETNPVSTETGKVKAQPTGGLYMFIEADSVPSPKPRRKGKPHIATNRKREMDAPVVNGTNDLSSDLCSENDKHINNVSDKKIKKADVHCKDGRLIATGTSATPPISINDNNSDKSFFVLIDSSSVKPPKRRATQRKFSDKSSVMSQSAPSDSILFKKDDSASKLSTPDTAGKLMTKSVIDREEFIAQPPARRNVSLNDKINESSKIPRPVSNFKERLLAGQKGLDKFRILKDSKHCEDTAHKRSKSVEQAENIETATSETASLSASFNKASTTTGPPLEIEDTSEVSDVSSFLSSLERSHESSDQDGRGAQNTLGDDLLKMFLNEINTDVTIQIGEKKLRAHKCILASRCVYFAAMLSGHWVESAGNVIKLQGFSVEAVTEALKHIYSGSSSVPEGVNVGELAALADMLALDGLKDVVTLHYKAKVCHYFHKPCVGCLQGVLQVLPIAGAYCLDELYHKCLKWIAKHFATVFPTRNFATLPSELQDRCLKQILDDMSVSNVIDVSLGSERIVSTLSVVRWAQPVFDLMAQLIGSTKSFVAANMSSIFSSERFLALGKDGGWNLESLEDLLKMSCDIIRPDQAVMAHIQLTKLTETRKDEMGNEFSEAFLSLCERLLNQIEKFIIHNANRVSVCRKWPLLTPETQKRIKDAALFVVEFSKPIAPKPTLSSSNKARLRGTSLEPRTRERASSMSDKLSRSTCANVIPPAKGVSTKRLQPTFGRCHTPPPSVLRSSLQTPPPTRASTLRAQARQAAIQRSQSARTVADKPKKLKAVVQDFSTDNEDASSTSSSVFSRGGTFTRSLSKTEPGRPRTPSHFVSVTSRSSTPGLTGRICHKRNSSGPPLVMPLEILTSDTKDSEKEAKVSSRGHPSPGKAESSANSKLLPAHLSVVQSRSSALSCSPHHPSGDRENIFAFPVSGSLATKKPLAPSNGNVIEDKRQEPWSPFTACYLTDSTKSRYNLVTDSDGNKPPNAHPSNGLPSPEQNATDVPKLLGGRSNTFCKDDVTPRNGSILQSHK